MINRIGEINKNRYGSVMKIINYKNYNNITVEFDNKFIIDCSYQQFKKGSVKNPYDKSVYGVGYLGEGKYASRKLNNGEHTKQYETWIRMLDRCYSFNYKNNFHTYAECYACDDWHNFQVFAEWFDENIYSIDNENVELDKDILIKGNKIYSSETCVFVPHCINSLFTKTDAKRGEYPIGVTLNKKYNKFYAQCNNPLISKYMFLGSYNNPQQAFFIYKEYKEKLIKEIANKYKNIIPTKLYIAMLKYIVEIND